MPSKTLSVLISRRYQWCLQYEGPNLEAVMTAAGTYLARSIGLLILPAFIVAYFAIIPSAPAQQQPGLEVIVEYNGTVAAAREAEVAPRLEGLLSKIDFSAGHAAAISRCAWLSRNSISDA